MMRFVLRVSMVIGAGVAAVAAASALAGGTLGTDRAVRFADLPHGTVPGLPRDVRSVARIVGKADGHTIAAAPTRNGNYCEAFKLQAGGVGGCRVRAARRSSETRGNVRAYLVGATMLSKAGNGGRVIAVMGSTLAQGRPHLFARFRGGGEQRLPLIWVSRPIGAGFYFYAVPKAKQNGSRRLVFLELRTGSRLVARQVVDINAVTR